MPEFFNPTSRDPWKTKKNVYRGGGAVKGGRGMGVALRGGGRVAAKDGKWIQKAVKGMRKDKPCTGKKFGSSTCPPVSKRYNLAKTFRKMAKSRKS